jgi:hypothetical protein
MYTSMIHTMQTFEMNKEPTSFPCIRVLNIA